ncbi:hypothetical protein F511_14200 [Dorcoceras hygrometricum]|uniref:Uncharacterized protein n=1 Tax=Dorcoceras hygrometricum TaxID=472368 RepID=A0A2Z7D0V8_9LAMI|nr:hypothetical protein F511_14200 [Dorcoceras hygrometricum]
MASAYYSNTQHIDFESVLAMDDLGMVSKFQAIMASGLEGFLGCPAVIYEASLVDLFENTLVRDGVIISTVAGQLVEISEEWFEESFDLLVDGFADLSEIPKDVVFDARGIVSMSADEVAGETVDEEATDEGAYEETAYGDASRVNESASEPAVADIVNEEPSTADDVDVIIEQSLCILNSFLVDWDIKMRIMPPEIETSIYDAKYNCFVGREHCDVLSMQMDSDLMIYRTILVRTFQVVTICPVDKSEVLVVLISPHDSKLH